MLSTLARRVARPALVRHARDSSNLARIKEVRDRSGAPMHEVKAALVATAWDVDAALEELRARGHAAASKKAARVAAEGLVGVASSGRTAVLVEMNSETDFVARNPKFQALLSAVAASALKAGRTELQDVLRSAQPHQAVDLPVEVLQALRLEDGTPVSAAVTALAAEVRENIKLRRASWLGSEDMVIGAYAHSGPSRSTGRIGSVVALRLHDSTQVKELARKELEQFATQVAMHVAAIRPTYVGPQDIPVATLEAERANFQAQAAASGKPANIADKMVEGWLQKWQSEVCLLQQSFVMNDDVSVKTAAENVAAKASADFTVARFVRLQVGEGIEREAKSFAAEVAAAARS